MRNAPQLLRDFFIDAPQPDPDWLDHNAFAPGDGVKKDTSFKGLRNTQTLEGVPAERSSGGSLSFYSACTS